jgi:hypothetical protein
MSDHDLIREARRFGGEWGRALADRLEAAKLEKAAEEFRDTLLRGSPGWFDTPAGKRFLAALAGVPAEPATEEKP